MYTVSINKTNQHKFQTALQNYCRSIGKINVTVVCRAASDKAGFVEVSVNGRQGVGYKEIVIYHDDALNEWIAVCDSIEYHLIQLSEIKSIVKGIIRRLNVLVNKM